MAAGIVLLFTGISCGNDSNDDGDGIPPTVIVENVTIGGTLTLSQEEGISFHLTLTDEVGLSAYTVSVEDTDIQVSESISGVEHTASIEVSGLSTGETYSVTIIATNTEGLQSSFNFNLILSEDPLFANLYLVGDATPGGWSLDDKTPFTEDESNSLVFTWTGELVEGNFKISTNSADFDSGDWIHPVSHDQDFSVTDFVIINYGTEDHDDNQWIVGEEEAGTFTIMIDLEAEEIHFELE